MKQSALKRKTNVSNNPKIMKLFKKNKESMLLKYFQKHMPHNASGLWKFCKPLFSNETRNFSDKIILA